MAEPANSFLKAEQIAAASLGLFSHQIVVPALTWMNAVGDFTGAAGDAVTIRVPAKTAARTRTLRDGGPLTMDHLTESSVTVHLDKDIYNGIEVSDEQLTLDIANFGQQVLAPQTRAVAEAVEEAVLTTMRGAVYQHAAVNISAADPFSGFVDARKVLNDADVPQADRFIVVGSAIEAALLKSGQLKDASQAGDNLALRQASLGTIAGYPIVVSNSLDEDEGFMFHRTAFVTTLRAPVVPAGAAYGQSLAANGLALRWIRDYDAINVRDRSIVSTYLGSGALLDGDLVTPGEDDDPDTHTPAVSRAVKLTRTA